MTPEELSADYRRQLSRYLSPRDCDRIIPILLTPPAQRSDADRAVLTDAAGIIRYIRQTA